MTLSALYELADELKNSNTNGEAIISSLLQANDATSLDTLSPLNYDYVASDFDSVISDSNREH